VPARLFPRDAVNVVVALGPRRLQLSNLTKVFWPDPGITKGDLLQYYATVASVLLPHIHDRPMVMRRYPDGIAGPSFFMKQAPTPRPDWIAVCPIHHRSGKVVEFPLIQDLPSLLWVVNLGCIDLNPWHARRDDPDRPDVLYFDLDPGPAAPFARVREAALVLHESLRALELRAYARTTGGRGLHVGVPIRRGPTQDQVWGFSRALATELAARNPKLLTIEYSKAKRPPDRVLVDYNQNAWGQTLASVYSPRPTAVASVSTPVTWRELARAITPADFRLDNVPARVRRRGDLWAPLAAARGRCDLARFLAG